ncbi:hypothetical protein TRAPUB_1546 [Trametes pubescens]|uniref:Uncharacterized protein n=1 Tax=Trametes pubescens TaxID=154538 RepID=A0A1M2VJ48_TRAPU|nr:hypothetical protein TRAPUB_1546 [Trametes pubescens]
MVPFDGRALIDPNDSCPHIVSPLTEYSTIVVAFFGTHIFLPPMDSVFRSGGHG